MDYFTVILHCRQRRIFSGKPPKGSILSNIHEVWPHTFWRGSSHQKKHCGSFHWPYPFASLEGDKRPDKINKKSREFDHFMP